MKPTLVLDHYVAKNPEPGVFLPDGTPAVPPQDTHLFCAGSYVIWVDGRPVKECVAAPTQTGFREVER